MSYLEDTYDFRSYDLQLYTNSQGPPLIKKTSRLIAAVVQNQVDVLRDLLDSPEWYDLIDKDGYNLMQIAILRENKEAFDCMMSLPDFPLEFVNKKGQTALSVSLCEYVNINKNRWMSEHFAYELLKKGACIDIVCYDDNTPLHCALKRSYMRVAKFLIEAGVDVSVPNKWDETPLDMALQTFYLDTSEAVTALLVYGAEPSFEHFRTSVVSDIPLLAQENLFLYLCDDEYSKVEIDLVVPLKLAERKSPLLHHLIKFPIKVNVNKCSIEMCRRALFSMDVDSLKIVIENFEPCISQVFTRNDSSYDHESYHLRFYTTDCNKTISIENLNVMLLSPNIRSDLIAFINTLNSTQLFGDLIIGLECGESVIEKLYCFLLSYGLNIDEMDLQLVYKAFGYCDLFKILLHMDFKSFDVHLDLSSKSLCVPSCFPADGQFTVKNIMPIFIYDASMNLEKFLTLPNDYYANIGRIDEMFDYFAHPKLKEICYKHYCVTKPRENLPQIPFLTELSRNAFRKFFIEKFQITTSSKFFTLLNSLPISITHKKIITYETKLY